jgi:hypothetical protein
VRNAIASVLDHYSLEDFVFPQKGVPSKSVKRKRVVRVKRSKAGVELLSADVLPRKGRGQP